MEPNLVQDCVGNVSPNMKHEFWKKFEKLEEIANLVYKTRDLMYAFQLTSAEERRNVILSEVVKSIKQMVNGLEE